jgi:hypothetical protein
MATCGCGRKGSNMGPLYEDPHFTFRFADDRIIPWFHLEGVEAGRRVSVFKIDPGTGERLSLLATATVGEGGWAKPNRTALSRSSLKTVRLRMPLSGGWTSFARSLKCV